jgi:hypothetical protein
MRKNLLQKFDICVTFPFASLADSCSSFYCVVHRLKPIPVLFEGPSCKNVVAPLKCDDFFIRVASTRDKGEAHIFLALPCQT